MGIFRYGEWELPAETILGMAGIHNPVARSRCITDLEREGVAHPGLPDLLHIRPHALFRVLERHGGKRPPIMAVSSTQRSLHADCTTARFDMMMEDLQLMDDEPTTRYETFMEFCHDVLERHPQVRTAIFFSAMVSAQLEYWDDEWIGQLPQAIAYAVSLHPPWRKAALKWLMPYRETCVPDYIRRKPKVRRMLRLCGKKWPDVPT